jgi:hypothetical protein
MSDTEVRTCRNDLMASIPGNRKLRFYPACVCWQRPVLGISLAVGFQRSRGAQPYPYMGQFQQSRFGCVGPTLAQQRSEWAEILYICTPYCVSTVFPFLSGPHCNVAQQGTRSLESHRDHADQERESYIPSGGWFWGPINRSEVKGARKKRKKTARRGSGGCLSANAGGRSAKDGNRNSGATITSVQGVTRSLSSPWAWRMGMGLEASRTETAPCLCGFPAVESGD